MIVGFKHIDSAFADAFGSGQSIQLGTHSHYRALEFDRADTLEGIVKLEIDHLHHSPDNLGWRVVNPILSEISEITGYGEVIMTNVSVVDQIPDAYIFSCSSAPDESLIRAGLAVFKIRSLEDFANKLAEANPSFVGKWIGGSVQYVARQGNPFDDPSLVNDYFKKSADFSWENELRIVFQPIKEPPDPVIRLKAPLAAALLERVH